MCLIKIRARAKCANDSHLMLEREREGESEEEVEETLPMQLARSVRDAVSQCAPLSRLHQASVSSSVYRVRGRKEETFSYFVMQMRLPLQLVCALCVLCDGDLSQLISGWIFERLILTLLERCNGPTLALLLVQSFNSTGECSKTCLTVFSLSVCLSVSPVSLLSLSLSPFCIWAQFSFTCCCYFSSCSPVCCCCCCCCFSLPLVGLLLVRPVSAGPPRKRTPSD